jgi:lupus La protein
LKERFARAPHIGYKRGDDHGYVGFDKPLTEEEVTFVKDTVKQINGRDVAWHHATEEEERAQQLDRARFAASRALSSSTPSSARGGRGGRGGSRGGRGGSGRGGRGGGKRGGSGDKRGEKKESGAAASESADGETGAKRKRGVEPDGGLHVGERNAGVPTLVSAAKKQKTEA